MSKPSPIRAISSRVPYENPWIRIREDTVVRDNGSEGIYGVVESKDSVIVAAVNENQEIYLIESYSYPFDYWGWWFPGGGGDGESAIEAGKRELAEETGLVANDWQNLGVLRVCNGLLTEKMSVLLARDISFAHKLPADDSDVIAGGKFVPLGEIDEMIADGRIDDSQTISALYLVRRQIENKESAGAE